MDTNVTLGATVSFRVYANSGSPMTYQWQHNGTNLPATGTNILILTDVTVADAGGYRATVSNDSGFTNSRTATLAVDPTFTKIMTGVVVTDSEGSISGNWADYNNDGFPELFVANSDLNTGVRNTLYHNNGGTNFSRVAASPFTNDYMRAWSAAWADYNNDGNVDLIVANTDGGTLAQRLYRNDTGGSFTAVVDSALRSDTTVAACPWWMDYDNDGFLDLFMAKGHYASAVANDCLFRNNGDGTFRKMTAAEVGPLVNDQLRNNICASVDYDNDGHQELSVDYWINWSLDTNSTWRCLANGSFEATTAFDLPDAVPFRWWADYDNDGWLDAFGVGQDPVAGWMPSLFRNLGAGAFTDVTVALNVTAPLQVWGATWGDYDNDGWLDLYYIGSYHVQPSTPNGLFRNNRDGTFTQITNGSPVWDSGNRVAPSWADYDNDGFLDLFIPVGDATPARNLLYRNNGNTNHWLKVKLDGRASNRSGIHARVRATATINGQPISQMREITCENAYAGQNGLLAHFGLGDATNVATLRIEWPSGIVQEIQNVAANQFLTVVESQGYLGAAPSFTGATKDASGSQLSFTEPAVGARYLLEASTDLVTWTKLLARTSIGVATNYTDTRATNYPSRFYRLQVP